MRWPGWGVPPMRRRNWQWSAGAADRRHGSAYAEALVLHALGRDDESIARLHAAVDDRDVLVTFLGVDGKWDALRGSPAFAGVLSRVGLEAVSTPAASDPPGPVALFAGVRRLNLHEAICQRRHA